jgi:hypothetical protein
VLLFGGVLSMLWRQALQAVRRGQGRSVSAKPDPASTSLKIIVCTAEDGSSVGYLFENSSGARSGSVVAAVGVTARGSQRGIDTGMVNNSAKGVDSMSVMDETKQRTEWRWRRVSEAWC